QDLFVVSGGNEFAGTDEPLRSRLYLNDGRGRLTRDLAGLPPLFGNGGCVAVADYDADGDQDLFLGHRVASRAYGRIPTSHLLRNEGKGRFVDVTNDVAPEVAQAGMVSGALWLDVDGDSALDLVVVGEWMPVRVFHQDKGRFTDRRSAGLDSSEGWWSSVTAADVDGDGSQDLVLGNLGRNAYVRASRGQPATLHVGDFFGTGTVKQLLAFHKPDGRRYPMAGRDDLLKLMPALRSRYPSFASFGASRVEDILGEELAKAEVHRAYTLESAVALHRGNRFELQPLPTEAQFAPVYASVVDDFDGDGVRDVYVAGNLWGVTPMLGRYDASRGLLLRGKNGALVPSAPAQSGMTIDGAVRAMAIVRRAGGGRLLAVARNNATLQLFSLPR
ncbi:MAG: VCBS repeat-containing protein, partial [Cytophagaceae bacterium]|nr:VCBS repeat-containing protein [Gemmatimonadaceae bacterium]